jgi:hypothetical protein
MQTRADGSAMTRAGGSAEKVRGRDAAAACVRETLLREGRSLLELELAAKLGGSHSAHVHRRAEVELARA